MKAIAMRIDTTEARLHQRGSPAAHRLLRRLVGTVIGFVAISVALGACSASSNADEAASAYGSVGDQPAPALTNAPTSGVDYPVLATPPAPAPTPTPPPWIRMIFGKPYGSRDITYQGWVERSSRLPSFVKWANVTFPQPGTALLYVYIGECDQRHEADYGEGNVIRICNSFVYKANDDYHDYYKVPYSSANHLSEGLMYFIFFHELAHAIEANYDLPVLGGTEASADEFASLTIARHPGLYDPAAAFIKWLWVLRLKSGEEQKQDLTFEWDAHPFDTERASQIACFLFSASPVDFAFLQTQYGLIGADEQACRTRYDVALRSWRKVLSDPRYGVGAAVSSDSSRLFP